MSCTADSYKVSTSKTHTPTWSGTLDLQSDGSATFTLDGGVRGGGAVTVHCGSDAIGNWIEFTNHHATPHTVHYQKAHWEGDGYLGPCDNDSNLKDEVDDWTATPTTPTSVPPGSKHY